MKLSILICTLNERKAELARLMEVLKPQLCEDVELLIDCDNREVSIGAKRQRLIEKATGDYVCFVDDDDLVSQDYVSSILKAVETEPDCVAITGIFTQNGARPKPFYHSIHHKKWFTEKTGFYRSPNHLNPIKRSIVLQVGYKDMSRGEDFDFSTRVFNLLKTETKIETSIYYYLSISEHQEYDADDQYRKPDKMKAIILANGQATRFNGQCKQVLPVNGEPVIMRTVRQLKENGINDVLIVTVWDEIKVLYDNCLDVGHTKGVVKTIEGCRDRWVETNDTILFLLGDVVWTDEAIKIAIETNKNVAFFGSEVEIFAVRVTPSGKSEFINGIRLCNFYKEFTTWVLYRLMSGFGTQQHKFETEMFVKITDKTDDIDYPSKYESRVASGYYSQFGTAPVVDDDAPVDDVEAFPIAETVQEVNENMPETVVDDKKVEEMPKIVKKRGRKPKNLL